MPSVISNSKRITTESFIIAPSDSISLDTSPANSSGHLIISQPIYNDSPSWPATEAYGVGQHILSHNTNIIPSLADIYLPLVHWETDKPYKAITKDWNGSNWQGISGSSGYLTYNGQRELYLSEDVTPISITVQAYCQIKDYPSDKHIPIASKSIQVSVWQQPDFPAPDLEWSSDNENWTKHDLGESSKNLWVNSSNTATYYVRTQNYSDPYPIMCPSIKFIDHNFVDPYTVELFIYLVGSMPITTTIDWGDSTTETKEIANARLKHTYASSGIYNVTISAVNNDIPGCDPTSGLFTHEINIGTHPVTVPFMTADIVSNDSRNTYRIRIPINNDARTPINYVLDYGDGNIDNWSVDNTNSIDIIHQFTEEKLHIIKLRAWNEDNEIEQQEFCHIYPYIESAPVIENLTIKDISPLEKIADFDVIGHRTINGGMTWRNGQDTQATVSNGTIISEYKDRQHYQSRVRYNANEANQTLQVRAWATSGDSGKNNIEIITRSEPIEISTS